MLSFLDELNKINKNSDIALTIQLTGKLIEQFHETQSVEINRFKELTKRIVDFIVFIQYCNNVTYTLFNDI